MTATTCTLTRRGEVDDLAGPWQSLLGRLGMLDDFLRSGVAALVPRESDEEFRRAMVIALSDGTAGTEHAIDVPGRGRRWLAWSLDKRADGRLDGVVVDVTRTRAGSAWNVASEVAPRLTGACPDLSSAAGVLLRSVARGLDGDAELHHTGPHTSPAAARAAATGRGVVSWHADAERCEVALPIQWPGGGTSVLVVRTPIRLDLWLDQIHLEVLAGGLGAALLRVELTAREIAAVARERHVTETLARELQQPMRLLHRTLAEASRVEDAAQRAYLLDRASDIGTRLGRITELVTTAAVDTPLATPAPQSLVEALAASLDDTAVVGDGPPVPEDLLVLADHSLLVRTLALAVQVVATPHGVHVTTSTQPDTVRLHVHAAPSPTCEDGSGEPSRIGMLLLEQLAASCGGAFAACEAGPMSSCEPADTTGLVLALPRAHATPQSRP